MIKAILLLALICFTANSNAQELTVRSMSGERINIEEYVKENPNVVVNVWQISCRPCLIEIPVFQRIVAKNKQWKLLLVTIDKDYNTVTTFLKATNRKNWIVHFDNRGTFVKKFNIQSTPYTLIYKNGKLVRTYNSTINEEKLTRIIK